MACWEEIVEHPREQRRTDRVAIALSVEVSGTDINGETFRQQAHTLVISRHGATLVLGRKLNPGHQLTVHRLKREREGKARIIGQLGGQSGAYIYALALTDPGLNLWDVRFPPLAESEKAVVRVLLECSACLACELAYLNELETEVLESNRCVSRSCTQCADWTIWKQVPHEPAASREPVLRDRALAQGFRARTGRTQTGREDIRLRLSMTACVRQPGLGEEVIQVENLSRGGLCFLSAKEYLEGSRIEVAVPYSQGTANIFVPARIVRVETLPGQEVKKYGVQYMRARRLGT